MWTDSTWLQINLSIFFPKVNWLVLTRDHYLSELYVSTTMNPYPCKSLVQKYSSKASPIKIWLSLRASYNYDNNIALTTRRRVKGDVSRNSISKLRRCELQPLKLSESSKYCIMHQSIPAAPSCPQAPNTPPPPHPPLGLARDLNFFKVIDWNFFLISFSQLWNKDQTSIFTHLPWWACA